MISSKITKDSHGIFVLSVLNKGSVLYTYSHESRDILLEMSDIAIKMYKVGREDVYKFLQKLERSHD